MLILFFLGWVTWFEPYEIEQDSVQSAQVKFGQFVFYSLTPKGREVMISGKQATKNEEKLRIERVFITKWDDDGNEKNLRAKVGVYKMDGSEIVELVGNVRATTKDFELSSAKVDYHIKIGIIEANSIFKLSSPTRNIYIEGRKLTYNFKTKKLLAHDILARINLK